MGAVIVLSLYYQHGRLGASYYDLDRCTAFMFEDLAEDMDYQVIRALLQQVDPTIVLVSKAQDVSVLSYLNKTGILVEKLENFSAAENKKRTDEANQRKNGDTNEEFDNNNESLNASNEDLFGHPFFALHIMPNTAFDYEEAKKRIVTLLCRLNDIEPNENNVLLSLRLNTSAVNMIRSMGALLMYLDAVRLGVEFEGMDVRSPIYALENSIVEEIVEINPDTYRALGIFHEERHPSAQRAYSHNGVREGNSLFRLCDRCRSTSGRLMLRCWFKRPTTNKEVIEQRHEAIKFFVQDCNSGVLNFIQMRLKRIGSLKGILMRTRVSTLSLNDWCNLYTACALMGEIANFIHGSDVHLKLIDDLLGVRRDILGLTALMSEIIDFEQSRYENRFVINRGVDTKLDKLKEIYQNLPETLTKVARSEADRFGLQSCSVCYVPMFGYMLSIPVGVDISREGFELLYENNGNSLVKTETMRQLDNEIGDVKMEIIDSEMSAMRRLKHLLHQNSSVIYKAMNACSVLDCVIALAITAHENNWHCPQYVDETVIEVVNGRHPISEILSPSKFIANAVKSGGAFSKINIITGPNTSGKSIYLKQVGLIVYLTHIGSFVPADKAVIGPFTQIMTRMYTVDCITNGLSSFAIDLKQETGLSLLTSILNYWIRKGAAHCPHVFVITHFDCLPMHLNPENDLVSFSKFDMIQNGTNFQNEYRLHRGFSKSSYALEVSRDCGIDDAVLQRAKEIFNNYNNLMAVKPAEIFGEGDDLLYKILPVVEQIKNYDIDNDCRGFLKLLEKLFICSSDAKLDQSTPGVNDQHPIESRPFDDFQKFVICPDLQDKLSVADDANSSSSMIECQINCTSDDSLKLQRKSRNVSFLSPVEVERMEHSDDDSHEPVEKKCMKSVEESRTCFA